MANIDLYKFQENKEGLELLKVAIAKAGYTGKVLSFCLFINVSNNIFPDST